MLFFIAGLLVGAVIGAFALSLLVAARDADSRGAGLIRDPKKGNRALQ